MPAPPPGGPAAAGARQRGGVVAAMGSEDVFAGKTVLLGVSGGIAAYKAAALCSRLVQAGAAVHVLMTPAAARLVAPLTFQALSGNPVQTDLLAEQRHGHVDHVYLARRADLLVVAPATANTVARLAAGLAGDPVSAAALGVTCPVLVCPSMEEHMYRHPATQANLRRLRDLGYHVMEPGHGYLASGLRGTGRLPEPEAILREAARLLEGRGAGDLAGVPVLVTAGPTREALDPVRFLSNRSTGKMGYAVARRAARRGAAVVLVAGPGALPDPPGVEVVHVESALEMHRAVMERAAWLRVAVAAAAVSDFRPAAYHPEKIKKGADRLVLELVRNPDILADLGRRKRPDQVLVGFAAETSDVDAYAARKLEEKNLDFVVANDVTRSDAGFAVDTNRAVLLHRDGRREDLPLMSKDDLAEAILDRVAALLRRGAPDG